MYSQTILIADRQTTVLNALTTKLRTNGFLVTTAADGVEAHVLARNTQPDVIVVDCQLPQLSGPELCVKLNCDPFTAHIPIVLMAAEGFDASAIPSDNVTHVIEKPFTPHQLLSVVQGLLSNEFSPTDANEPAVSCAW